MPSWSSVIKTMSDDPALPPITTPTEGMDVSTPSSSSSETAERNIKTEPSTTPEQTLPLSQQPEPPKDSYQSVLRLIQQHDETMLKNKLAFSALPREQREEYNKLVKQKDDLIEAMYSHAKQLKEDETDFANENPEEWRDDFTKDHLNYKAIAYCAASAKQHARNIEEKKNLKRRIEELENEKKTASAPSQQQQPAKVITTGNAISNFTQKLPEPASQTSVSQQPTQGNGNGNGNDLKIGVFEKFTHKDSWMDNPTRPANILSASLDSKFGWFAKPLTTNK